jgi:hypothetical protein
LFKELLPGRPMQIVHHPENERYFCSVELYGKMPATPPCVVQSARTPAMAVMLGMIHTLIAVEIDYWS